MSPFDTPEDYIKVPVWDERANKKVLDSLIISCRTFAEERREGIEREYFDDSIYDAYH